MACQNVTLLDMGHLDVQLVKGYTEMSRAKTNTVTRKTIKRGELARLAFCNSKDLPNIVEINGKRKQWVGIGWVDCGEPHGTEILVIT